MDKKTTLEEILASDLELEPKDDPLAQYSETSPLLVALAALDDCVYQLQKSQGRGIFLVFAARAAHTALQSALIAGLAGSANIGALSPKLRKEWLDYFERSRTDNEAQPPRSQRVMPFDNLLEEATSNRLGWGGEPLQINAAGRTKLERLKEARHTIEHPKQATHLLSPEFLVSGIQEAIIHIPVLLEEIWHNLDKAARREMYDRIDEIERFCAEVEPGEYGKSN